MWWISHGMATNPDVHPANPFIVPAEYLDVTLEFSWDSNYEHDSAVFLGRSSERRKRPGLWPGAFAVDRRVVAAAFTAPQ